MSLDDFDEDAIICRCPEDPKIPYTVLDNRIIDALALLGDFEAIGVYGMLEYGSLQIKDVPKHIISHLIQVGYLEEVKK